jgi:hypothetical protein
LARKTLSTFEALWEKHEELYMIVFAKALLKLSSQNTLSGDEDSISEKLCISLREVCFEFNKENINMEIPIPKWETPLQPVSEIELKGGKKRKRPDFTCSCINTYAYNPDDYEIPFHVECKCLGRTTISGWNYNKNYVQNGIVRYDALTHEYGKRAPSGLMIGYIISMKWDLIQNDVNYYLANILSYMPELNTFINIEQDKIYQVDQELKRKVVSPPNFRLIHLWVDLSSIFKFK